MNSRLFRSVAGWGSAVLALGLFSCALRDVSTTSSDPNGVALVARFESGATVPSAERGRVVLSVRSGASSTKDTVYKSGAVLNLGTVPANDSFSVSLFGYDVVSGDTLYRWWSRVPGKADPDSAVQAVTFGTIDSVASPGASVSPSSLVVGASLGLIPSRGDTFWYTTDSSDPRVSATRRKATGAVSIDSAWLVTAAHRTDLDSTTGKPRLWSAPCAWRFKAAAATTATDSSYFSNAYTAAIPWNASSSIVYGSFVDARDNKLYKTVTIGTQKWMAQNLDFRKAGTATSAADTAGACYVHSADSCLKYGRLYTWPEAMAGASSTSTGNVRGICPMGWHVPSSVEWDTLAVDVGKSMFDLESSTGWSPSLASTDAYGFRLLPAGQMDYQESDGWLSVGIGFAAELWTSTSGTGTESYADYVENGSGSSSSSGEIGFGSTTSKLALRCIAD